jgi:uncharacterized protein (DUF58 family)
MKIFPYVIKVFTFYLLYLLSILFLFQIVPTGLGAKFLPILLLPLLFFFCHNSYFLRTNAKFHDTY